jgi:hypothetical protein
VEGWFASHRVYPGDIHHPAAKGDEAEFGLINKRFANFEAERMLRRCFRVVLGCERCYTECADQGNENMWFHDDARCTGA